MPRGRLVTEVEDAAIHRENHERVPRDLFLTGRRRFLADAACPILGAACATVTVVDAGFLSAAGVRSSECMRDSQ